MKDSFINIQQGQWTTHFESDNKSSFLDKKRKSKIKTRLGFVYFVALVSSLIILFTR